MGSKSSTSQSASTTNQYDQRQVNSTDSHAVTYDYDWTTNVSDSRNQSQNINATDSSSRSYSTSTADSHNSQISATDSSSRSYADSHNSSISATDSSSRSYVDSRSNSTTDSGHNDYSTYTANNVDAAAVSKYNADLLRGISSDQSDAVKAVSQMQLQGLEHLGGAFTDLSSLASNNQAAAWTHTVDAGSELLGRVVDASNKNADATRLVAQAAISSYQPSDNKTADTFKYGLIAAAVLGAIVLMTKG